MNKIILFSSFLFLLSNCNQHNQVKQINTLANTDVNSNLSYNEKPFDLKWKIQKNSITNIPADIHKKIRTVCKNHNKFVLVKIKTFEDDTALGTFDCRI